MRTGFEILYRAVYILSVVLYQVPVDPNASLRKIPEYAAGIFSTYSTQTALLGVAVGADAYPLTGADSESWYIYTSSNSEL